MPLAIDNRYQVLEELGSGGMGVVYKGLDLQTNQLIAIKQLNPNLIDPELIERFRREGQALRELNHPNIVKMLAAIEEYGNHYLIMEYVSGGDLRSLTATSKRLPLERVLNIAIDLADALTRAHRLDIIHRDLKPANLLIAKNGTLRLSDFGVAYVIEKERVTDQDTIIGTVDYMAPEVLKGEIIDARTDIWSFGVMLFELLTGTRPFKGESSVQVIHDIMMKPLPDIEALSPDIPVALADLVYWMLEKDHNARIRSVRLVGAELETILQGNTDNRTPRKPKISHFNELPSTIAPAEHNLPIPPTSFIGREDELSKLLKLIDKPNVRLITVLAPGGMGKSRLVIEMAQRIVTRKTHFPNGVYFIELATLSNTDDIITAIANTLGFQLSVQDTPKAQILKYLTDKNMLLIMDNYEHVLVGAELIDHILHTSPYIKVVVTSRERLNLMDEQIFALGGLDTSGHMPESSAAQLFMQSAGRVRPGFELAATDFPHLKQICHLVDGMPLAIVLAAVWVESLSLEEIAHELEVGIDILETDIRTIPRRQQSIRRVFDYSWRRLDDTERLVFARSSVFMIGMTRPAIQAVVGATLRTIQSLVNKGLFQRDTDTGRFHTHELARQYAAERLDEFGQTQAVYDAHMNYYAQFVQDHEHNLKGRDQLQALAEMEADFENIRMAWMRSAEGSHFYNLERMSDGLSFYCYWKNRQIGHNLFSFALPKIPLDAGQMGERLWGRLSMRHAMLSAHIRHEELKIIYERSLAVARQYDDKREIGNCSLLLSSIAGNQDGPQAALTLLQESLDLFTSLDYQFGIAYAFHLMGFWVNQGQGGTSADSERYIRQAVHIRESIGDLYGLVISTNNLADRLFYAHGNFDEAEMMYRDVAKRAREMALPDAYCLALGNLAFQSCLMGRGDVDETRHLAYKLSDIATDIANPEYIAMSLAILGLLDALEGLYTVAERKCLDGVALLNIDPDPSNMRDVSFGLIIAYCGSGKYESMKRLLFEYHFLLRRPLHVMPCIAVLMAHQGDYERAVSLLALTFTSPLSPKGWLRQWPFINTFREDMQSKLGEQAYHAAWERGKQLDMDTLIAELIDELG